MNNLHIWRRIGLALLVLVLFIVLVQVGPLFGWPPQLVRVLALICIALLFIAPLLPVPLRRSFSAAGAGACLFGLGLFGLFMLSLWLLVYR